MRKKLIYVSFLIVALCFTACGNTETNKTETISENNIQSQTTDNTIKETTDNTKTEEIVTTEEPTEQATEAISKEEMKQSNAETAEMAKQVGEVVEKVIQDEEIRTEIQKYLTYYHIGEAKNDKYFSKLVCLTAPFGQKFGEADEDNYNSSDHRHERSIKKFADRMNQEMPEIPIQTKSYYSNLDVPSITWDFDGWAIAFDKDLKPYVYGWDNDLIELYPEIGEDVEKNSHNSFEEVEGLTFDERFWTDSLTDAQISGKYNEYINLNDTMSFSYKGKQYTLGETTVKDLVDNGVQFRDDSYGFGLLNNSYFQREIVDDSLDYSIVLEFTPWSKDVRDTSDCTLNAIYVEGASLCPDIQFNIPTNLTEEQLTTNLLDGYKKIQEKDNITKYIFSQPMLSCDEKNINKYYVITFKDEKMDKFDMHIGPPRTPKETNNATEE